MINQKSNSEIPQKSCYQSSSLLSDSLKEWDNKNKSVNNNHEKIKFNNGQVAEFFSEEETEYDRIKDFQTELTSIITDILDHHIRPTHSDPEYKLNDTLPKFSGNIYITRIDRLQNIFLKITKKTKKKSTTTLLMLIRDLNQFRLELIDDIEIHHHDSIWYQDALIIKDRLLIFLNQTVAKYPFDEILKYWWDRNKDPNN